MNVRVRDLIGRRFGRLVVIEKLPSKKGKSVWRCKCDCGNIKDVPSTYLTSGDTKSCGCLFKEKSKENMKKAIKKAKEINVTHGLSNTRIYRIWIHMIRRTSIPSDPNYRHYGGRGIKVCEEWRDIRMFYEWAVNNGYKEDLQIDRIDVNGNYEPSNCRWATRKQQNNNKRDNVKTEINGTTHTLSEWSEITGVNINTLQCRYYKGDRGERLIRKAISSNTGITGISKTKEGKFQVDVSHKKKRYRAKTKTLEEAIKKKEEIINQLNKE